MFGSYCAYRASGMPWAQRIPEHWETAHLRYVADISNGTTPSRDRADFWENGTVPWLASGQVNDYIVRQAREFITPAAQKAASLRILPKGSVIVGLYGQGKTRGTSAYLNIDAVLIAGREYLRNEGRGGSQPNLNCEMVGSFSIPLPPLPEQTQIATYLRAQDAKIARFIRIKRELIEKLNEQKLALIDHAVTQGLNPNTPRKPSGVAWLGEVPGNWEVKPLKRWVQINACTLGETTSPDFTFRYVDIGSVQIGRLVKNLERVQFANAPSRARRILRRGDTIISTVRTYLKAIWYVDEEARDLIASTGFAVLTPSKDVLPEYLSYVIQSSGIVNKINANSIGIAYPAIAETVLGRFPVALPSLEEQHAILAHIKAQTAPIDRVITRAEQEITLIREYRERLIFDAVTGQIDLRDWQMSAEDMIDDEVFNALSDAGSVEQEDDDDET